MWTKIERRNKAPKNTMTLRLSEDKRGARMIVSIPAALSCASALSTTRVDVSLGREACEGKLKIEPAADGEFTISKLHNTLLIRFPVPPGVTLKANLSGVEYEEILGDIIITLPDWARPGAHAVVSEDAAPAPDLSKPGSLEINGNVLMMGGKQVKLSKSQAAIMRKMSGQFGKCVPKDALLDEIARHDANAETNGKSLDVMICNLRKLIAFEDMALAIVTHRGSGYELRRPVAG
jgi:hypothetical protein